MNTFVWSAQKYPGASFREMVYSGIESDAKRYSDRTANDEEPSELEILSSIIIAERVDAEATFKAEQDGKRSKAKRELIENNWAEEQLGLRGLATPSPTVTNVDGNPASVLGTASHNGETSLLLIA